MSFFKISYESDSIEGVKILMQGMASASNASPGLVTLDQAPPPNSEEVSASDDQHSFGDDTGQETPPPSFDSEASPDMAVEMGPPSPDDSVASFDASGEDIEGTNPPAASDGDSGFQNNGLAEMAEPPVPDDDGRDEDVSNAQPPKKSVKKSSKN